jgi:membrane protease YdiL (CAAX protease family)
VAKNFSDHQRIFDCGDDFCFSSAVCANFVYTLGLGLASGFFVFRFRSILGAVAIHFSFNLGFYLASLL